VHSVNKGVFGLVEVLERFFGVFRVGISVACEREGILQGSVSWVCWFDRKVRLAGVLVLVMDSGVRAAGFGGEGWDSTRYASLRGLWNSDDACEAARDGILFGVAVG